MVVGLRLARKISNEIDTTSFNSVGHIVASTPMAELFSSLLFVKKLKNQYELHYQKSGNTKEMAVA